VDVATRNSRSLTLILLWYIGGDVLHGGAFLPRRLLRRIFHRGGDFVITWDGGRHFHEGGAFIPAYISPRADFSGGEKIMTPARNRLFAWVIVKSSVQTFINTKQENRLALIM